MPKPSQEEEEKNRRVLQTAVNFRIKYDTSSDTVFLSLTQDQQTYI